MKKKIIHAEGETYMVRYYLFGDGSGKGYELYLHKLLRQDWARDPHDHPWGWFFALVLWGGYSQDVVDVDTKGIFKSHVAWRRTKQKVRWFQLFRSYPYKEIPHFRRFHIITKLKRTPTWTLVLVPPRHRSWGFFDQKNFQFLPYQEYETVYSNLKPKADVVEGT